VALPAPSDREKSQLYAQRYIEHFPAAGEVVVFDRSRDNRAGVEYVMGFCSKEEYRAFVESCPKFESHAVKAGILLVKFWLEVGQEEQRKRFEARIADTMRQWKLSPMDLESHARWYAYSRARDTMLEATDTPDAPWYTVPSDDKRRARLNCTAHLLRLIPYKDVPRDKVKLPRRSHKGKYDDQAILEGRTFSSEKY
jgi:polyphosphate kinase 2 (PPK2 family)